MIVRLVKIGLIVLLIAICGCGATGHNDAIT